MEVRLLSAVDTKSTVLISANTAWYLYNFKRSQIIHLLNRDYRVVCVAPRDEYIGELTSLGCEVIEMSINRYSVNPLSALLTLFKFAVVASKVQPDYLLTFTPKVNVFGGLYKLFLGGDVKHIPNVSGLGKCVDKSCANINPLLHALYKVSFYKSDWIVFQNEPDRRLFIAKNLVKADQSSRVIGSGVDLNRFMPGNNGFNSSLKFLIACRLIEEKGVRLFVEAAKAFRKHSKVEASFTIIGIIETSNVSAIKKSELNEWCKDGLIEYAGPTDSIENELHKYDCVVLPTYYSEGVPKVLMEAAACGVPVITTNTDGCLDTVEECKNGFLVEPQSVNSLLDAMLEYSKLSVDQRVEMSMFARRLAVRKFDEAQVFSEYDSIMEGLCEPEYSTP